MLICPGCSRTISGKDFARHYGFKPYRLCPHCQERIAVDPATKRRQFIAIVIGLVSLVLTIGSAFYGRNGWAATFASYVIFVAYIWWGNRHVRLVRYDD